MADARRKNTHSVALIVPIVGAFLLSLGGKPAAETLLLTGLSPRKSKLLAAAVAVRPPGAQPPAGRLVLRDVVVGCAAARGGRLCDAVCAIFG
jgi:hypothetical protein